MASKEVLRPTSAWTIVEHPGAYYSAEAVQETAIDGKRSSRICQIRLTNEDIQGLLELPAVQEMAKKVIRKARGDQDHGESS